MSGDQGPAGQDHGEGAASPDALLGPQEKGRRGTRDLWEAELGPREFTCLASELALAPQELKSHILVKEPKSGTLCDHPGGITYVHFLFFFFLQRGKCNQ